jgi:hypothetical protein
MSTVNILLDKIIYFFIIHLGIMVILQSIFPDILKRRIKCQEK